MSAQQNILMPDSPAPILDKYAFAWKHLLDATANADVRAHSKCWLTYRAISREVPAQDWHLQIKPVDTGAKSFRWRCSQATANAYFWLLIGKDHEKFKAEAEAIRSMVHAGELHTHHGAVLNYLRIMAIWGYMEHLYGDPKTAQDVLMEAVNYWRDMWTSFNALALPFRFAEMRSDCVVLHCIMRQLQALGCVVAGFRTSARWADQILDTEIAMPWWQCLVVLGEHPKAMFSALPQQSMKWPEGDKAKNIILKEIERLPAYLEHVESFDICIQAGGNTGMYALRLAESFKHVYTMEPCPEVFECLEQNIQGVTNIHAVQCALGAGSGFVTTERTEKEALNFGATFTKRAEAGIPVRQIDDLLRDRRGRVGFIMLDIEGDEPLALEGGACTIVRDKPVIALELKGLSKRHQLSDKGTIERLNHLGYKSIASIGRDQIFKFSGMTFACVLKTGGIYTTEHVERLYDQITTHFHDNFRFVCLTDDPAVRGITIPLAHGWPGWWSKIELFEHDLGRVCYLDLDVVIRDDITWINDLKTDDGLFHGMRDALSKEAPELNSSFMVWEGKRPDIAGGFDFERAKAAFHGDQNYIQSRLETWESVGPPFVSSFKKDGADSAAIVVYHGKPKPWEIE